MEIPSTPNPTVLSPTWGLLTCWRTHHPPPTQPAGSRLLFSHSPAEAGPLPEKPSLLPAGLSPCSALFWHLPASHCSQCQSLLLVRWLFNQESSVFAHFCILRTLIRVSTHYLSNEHGMDSLGESGCGRGAGSGPQRLQRGLHSQGKTLGLWTLDRAPHSPTQESSTRNPPRAGGWQTLRGWGC